MLVFNSPMNQIELAKNESPNNLMSFISIAFMRAIASRRFLRPSSPFLIATM